MSPAERIREAFGIEGTLWALFYKAPAALRFELGGDWSNIEAPVPRVNQALARARAICDALFPVEAPLTAVIATPHGPQAPIFDRTSDGEARDPWIGLPTMGFSAPVSLPVVEPMNEPDEEPYRFDWRTADLTGDRVQRDVLLWASITLETPVHPKAMANVWLVDFGRKVLAHVYDDRGMDVIASDREEIRFLYQRYGGWLLNGDRARMDADFG